MMDVQFAKVVKVHPEGHSVDLLMSKDARRMSGVRVLSSSAAGRSGLADLAAPDSQADTDPYDAVNTGKQDVFAMVIFVDGVPFVVGFLFPNVTEMLFSDVNRRIDRHPSDVYVDITDGGDVELAHPSGLFVRISESPGHEDLTGKDWQKKWAIRRNTGKQPHFHVEYPGRWSFDTSPQGDVVWDVKSLVVNAPKGSVVWNVDSFSINGTGMTFNASSQGGVAWNVNSFAVNAPQVGDAQNVNSFALNGVGMTFNASPQSGVAWSVNSFVVNGIDMVTHRHTGVYPGPSDTGGPISI